MAKWIAHFECPVCGESSRTPMAKCPFCKNKLESDFVSVKTLDQVRWERDVAIAQLAEVGKSLGERMDDVCRVGSYGDCGCGIKDGAGECCRKNVLTEEGG